MLDLTHRADLVWLATLLDDIRRVTPTTDWLLVGAMARDLWLSYAHNVRIDRETTDVDLAVAVDDWQQFQDVRGRLVASGRFESGGAVQRLRYVSGRTMDLVPFGGIEDSQGRVAWPPSGDVRMNVLGCREAKAASELLRLSGDVQTRVISLPGLILLKFFAFAERGLTQPRKDAHDLRLVIGNYLEAGNAPRLYDEYAHLLDAEDFDYAAAGARIAGRDVRAMLLAHSRQPEFLIDTLKALLGKELDPEGSNRLLGQVPLHQSAEFRVLLIAYYAGLTEA